MNVADLLIAILLVIGLLGGMARGFIRCLLGLAALVVGIMIAAGYHAQFADAALSFIPGKSAPQIVAFVVIFIAVIVLVGLVARLVAKAA